jgi:dCTP deaminase
MAEKTQHSLLSDLSIKRAMQNGSIIIEPFNQSNLATTSYDVTLGPHFFRETTPEPGIGIYNPYSSSMVDQIWGKPQMAETHQEWSDRTGHPLLDNIGPNDRIIWIKPGETILGHTLEYIGGRHTITSMMKARSSMGRNFIEVCKCAGWGDVGYVNRWTMEITNNSRHYSIPLVVGRRIAQIVFFDTEGIEQHSYETTGKYQTSSDLSLLKESWSPISMLPKMYQDREVRALNEAKAADAH